MIPWRCCGQASATAAKEQKQYHKEPEFGNRTQVIQEADDETDGEQCIEVRGQFHKSFPSEPPSAIPSRSHETWEADNGANEEDQGRRQKEETHQQPQDPSDQTRSQTPQTTGLPRFAITISVGVVGELLSGTWGCKVSPGIVHREHARDIDLLATEPAPILSTLRTCHVIAASELVGQSTALGTRLCVLFQQLARGRAFSGARLKISARLRWCMCIAVCEAVEGATVLALHLRGCRVARLNMAALGACTVVSVHAKRLETLVLANDVNVTCKKLQNFSLLQHRGAPVASIGVDTGAPDISLPIRNLRHSVGRHTAFAEHVLTFLHHKPLVDTFKAQTDLALERFVGAGQRPD